MEAMDLRQMESYEYRVLEAGQLPFEQLRALMDELRAGGWQLDGAHDTPTPLRDGGLALTLWLRRPRRAAA